MIVVIFDEESPHWSRESDFNRMFVTLTVQRANALLQTRGHVFLNDVYDLLGMRRTSQGAVEGWLYPEDPAIHVTWGEDHWVKNGPITLHFQTPGVIYDKIEEHYER